MATRQRAGLGRAWVLGVFSPVCASPLVLKSPSVHKDSDIILQSFALYLSPNLDLASLREKYSTELGKIATERQEVCERHW